MTYFLLRDYNILPKNELPLTPWVRFPIEDAMPWLADPAAGVSLRSGR